VDEARKETWVNDIPDKFLGPETRRLMDTAVQVGLPWEKMQKHIDFNKCEVGCTLCGSGCKKGAKWTGKVLADEAVKHGATLLTHTKVREVITENGAAVGVRARGAGDKRYEINGNAVVCCTGGIGTTPILKRAGIYDAGSWFVGDPSILMFGFLEEGRGPGYEHQMAIGNIDEEHGVLLSGGMATPFLTWFMVHLQSDGLKAFRNIGRYSRALGVWTKVHDDGLGRVFLNERVSKTFTPEDYSKMEYAKVILEKVLVKGGCNPYEIFSSGKVLGHPGGTAPIGRVVDSNLETQIKNLYCCDTSIMPEAPGRPPTWTVVSLAKRLADRLSTVA
jgi:choline dehydrogenase-like flavoprotein